LRAHSEAANATFELFARTIAGEDYWRASLLHSPIGICPLKTSINK
jgi:hypothetical protein